MRDPITTRIQRKLWTIMFGHESWIRKTGDFRTRESYGLVERPNYAYGMLRAADNARYYGSKAVSVVEMGVASGAGLLNMIECADQITHETGIIFNIFGFDTGAGLPRVEGFKDHPEIWTPGDFAMENREVLLNRIGGRAEIIWGDINDTIDAFTENLSEQSPLGFVSVDVDLYSATKAALRCLVSDSNKYLPAVSMYFDDVSFFTANPWCGELAAINEFNELHHNRKISCDRSLPGRRPVAAQNWYPSMYVCHVLDHEARQTSRTRDGLTIGQHYRTIATQNVS